MERRRYLLGLSVALASGCSQSGSETTESSPAPGDANGGIYVQPTVEAMAMAGQVRAGEYAVALLFTTPHRFWTVTNTERSPVPIDDDDSIHLMAVVWDAETRTVIPDTGLSVAIRRDGDLVSEEVIYPMLSQRMGFHYGGNFPLPADGTYTVDVRIGAVGVRTTGAFRNRFTEPATGTVDLAYTSETRSRIGVQQVEQGGAPGAVEPMSMDVPVGFAPAESTLPGEIVGTARSGDARFVVVLLETPPAGVDGTGPYLAVSPRTPYNRLLIPGMALSAALARDDSTVAAESLTRTLDPELGYHHGMTVPDPESGDTLTLRVGTPPQVARHEGYEEAFLEMPAMEIEI